ncbi:MAG: HAMP domain-containing sensor histidine kinase [Woeseiaceae bacterium]|nr:HAMP domain-containing sensor histidine kinase [Woeseiaceae bacterium]
MLSKSLVRGLDKRRLKWLLAALFLALAMPTAALIWQAYGQLKWQAFHQYRGLAEDFTGRADAALTRMIAVADGRSFADYAFLNVSGETDINFLQRSPLSAYPVAADLPGVMGYFQVEPDGSFSTPLLPPDGENVAYYGIGAGEYRERVRLARQIQSVLAENRLVGSRDDLAAQRAAAPAAEGSKDDKEQQAEPDEPAGSGSRSRQVLVHAERPAAPAAANAPQESSIGGELPSDTFADRDQDGLLSADRPDGVSLYSQRAFDELKRQRPPAGLAGSDPALQAPADTASENEQAGTIGKLADLELDAALQKKSESLEQSRQAEPAGRATSPGREKRREQIALPEATTVEESQPIANFAGPTDLRISTFESEIDPLDFSLLGSGHLVLFRNVWRDGERFIQGLLIEPEPFIKEVIEQAFYDSPLSEMSNLIVAYLGDVIRVFPGPQRSSDSQGAGELSGALLYQSRLSAPFDSLELVFSINDLPQGPGASVLGWMTLVLAIVFIGGFATLYRLGLGQINLARQQQDFVSAVSHELKTPLTSIRMYGEMLREGWADEAKRQDYYAYIHDESERLTRMISNVLKLAKINRNEPDLNMKPVKVGELISNIESKLSNQVERSGFAMQFDRDPRADDVKINIDEDCFTQIVINLVDNAIKFSRDAENKTIVFGSRCHGQDSLQFSVRDHGPGIPRDQMKKIFTLFYRSESELTRDTVGTGIGLAIVKQLTTAMQGKVDVVNKQPGAEFRISFPID